jgi:DNA repair exonuclease SbcCD ATPase subunit
MSDFLDSAKNFIGSTVSRTSWEAQKQLRVHAKQKEIEQLVQQRQQIMDELGQVAMTLYQQEALTDTQLSRLCASVLELDHDLRTREQQFQDLKAEGYPADQFAPAPTTNYAPPTPSTPSKPPFSGGSQPGAGASAQDQSRCPQCGNPVRAKSAYCRGCGAKLG